MSTFPFRFGRTSCLLISSLAIGWLALACQPGGTDSDEVQTKTKRFNFVRGKKQLLRVDSSTGQVWTVPENGDGGWIELKQAPGPDGVPESPGRYGVFSIVDRLNIAPNQLLLVDRATGRSWLRETPGGRAWNPISNANEASDEETPVPPAPKPARQASQPPPPQADKLPVLSRAVLDASGGDDQQKLQVVTDALQKPGLAIEIRVWAAKQLVVFDPEVAVPPLREALNDDQPEIVVAAIGSLSQLGDATTIPAITALKNHPDAKVQEAAKAALSGGR
ncbi:MAG: HEAT repeat domain-containing protein [Myxococcota bacterium]|nr:HEAT repeat domain-containing protein [Myxococcota bacterium]